MRRRYVCLASSVPMTVAAYYAKLETIAARHGIELTDMLGPLLQTCREISPCLFNSWDGHNNVAAKQVIAHEISGRITQGMQ